MEQSDHEIIQGILADARTEAERILREARESVEVRRRGLEERERGIRAEAAERAEREETRIRERTDRAIAQEERHARLALEERMHAAVQEEARRRLAKLAERDGYAAILRGWIVEAGIGLAAAQAVVRCSESERLACERALPDAEAQLAELTGRPVSLRLDTDGRLVEQGVVLTDPSGELAFGNRVSDRLRRYDAEIRRAVHRRLFGDE
jgi:vacuolar-type H+-ATPase subunit E/Vma4